MKNALYARCCMMLLLQVCIQYGFSQILYVKYDAQGNNDGSSWQHAFKDLQSALDMSIAGDTLWIAAGTYYPGSGSPAQESVFRIRHAISLYGGFIGTEQTLEERDLKVNWSILSGDIGNNDLPDDFLSNKSDNTYHVVYIDSMLSKVTLDGLRIKGGQAIDDVNASEYLRSGGGIYAGSPIDVNGCHISENFARGGGGIYLRAGASGSTITNSQFEYNKSSNRGACLYGFSASDLIIRNCDFQYNTTARGSVCIIYGHKIMVNQCNFEDNTNSVPGTACAGIFSQDSKNISIINCGFRRNLATGGAAIFCIGNGIPSGESTDNLIDSCQFEDNVCTNGGFGAGIFYRFNPDITISNCSFFNNAAGSGGGVAIDQTQAAWTDTSNVLIERCQFVANFSDDFGGGALRMDGAKGRVRDCHFIENTANYGGHVFLFGANSYCGFTRDTFADGFSHEHGGAVEATGSESYYEFDSCLFQSNRSEFLAGAVYHALGAMGRYANCQFIGNNANRGGAIGMNSDTTAILVSRTLFENNWANFLGGAIFSGNGNGKIRIDKCSLLNNRAGQGGVIYINATGNSGKAGIDIYNSILGLNVGSQGGAAIYAEDVNVMMVSTVLHNNFVNGTDDGAVIEIIATDTIAESISLLNSTLADSEGLQVAGVSMHSSNSTGYSKLHLQNTIFRTEGGRNFYKDGGPHIIHSLGGNMSNDSSMLLLLTHKDDLHLTEPQFIDPYFPVYDFSLKPDSPGIDDGVPDGAPELDILDFPRVNEPDMGAYEHQMPVWATEFNHKVAHRMKMFPNPLSQENINIIMPGNWEGPLRIQFADLQGVVHFESYILKDPETGIISMSTEELRTGMYIISIFQGNETVSGILIRER